MGRVGPYLHLLWAGDRDNAPLWHARVDSSVHWNGRPLVSLGNCGIRPHIPALSCGTPLGSCRHCRGLDSLVLDSGDSRLLVRGKANTTGCQVCTCRSLEIFACLASGWIYFCRNPQSRPIICSRANCERSAGPHLSSLSLVWGSLPRFNNPVARRMCPSL